MRKAVRVDVEAEEEIAEAIDRYERARPGLGGEFLDEISGALHALQEPGPECGPAYGVSSALGIRRKIVRRFPYMIVFVELDSTVRVIAVAHGAQRPGYWRPRIRRP